MSELFPFSAYWWFYAGFTLFILLLLALDLGVFHRRAHAVGFREAFAWSVFWVSLALVFNYLLYRYSLWQFALDPRLLAEPGFNPAAAARQVALEFLTGYLVEKSLSVDNVFVFVLVFDYFAVPPRYQHRVLFYGILGALIFRAIFIALGAALMQYQWVVILFGAFLLITGVKMAVVPLRSAAPRHNLLSRTLVHWLPVSQEIHGPHFLVHQGGRWAATPLLVALLFLETTDIIFAVDSVPAIFALTREPLIVFTSNIFAILGLRALYFLLAGAVGRFHLLRFGLAAILFFVGLKMVWLNQWFGGHFPIGASLAIIALLLAGSIGLSLLLPDRRAPAAPRAE